MTRTLDLRIRNPLLYPAELRAQIFLPSFNDLGSALSRLMTHPATIMQDTRQRRFLLSAVFRLCLDDVGIGAGTVAVICTSPVVIIRVRRQPGNVSTCDIANVQVSVLGHLIDKSRVRSHIQPVTKGLTFLNFQHTRPA